MTAIWSSNSLSVFACYLLLSVVAHVAWEFAHMPLEDVWNSWTSSEILYNGLHCSIGDVMVASAALLNGVLVAGRDRWPLARWPAVSAITIVAGLAYTGFSEWPSTSVRNAWAYSDFMPLLPGTGIGVSPVAQWIIIPSAALTVAHQHDSRGVKKTAALLSNMSGGRS